MSHDISIMINGQEYHLEGTKTSNSTEFQSEVLRRLDGIEQELTMIKHAQATLQTSVYWVLAAVGIFLAAMTIPAAIASIISVFRKGKEEAPDSKSIVASLSDAFMTGLTLGKESKSSS